MVDFSVQFNIFAYGAIALLFVIMLVSSVSALFIMHKRRFGAFSVIHYIFSWLAFIVALALTLLALDYRLQLIPIDKAPFGIPVVTEFLTLVFTTLMTEITVYATLLASIFSLIVIPFGWGERANFMLPVMPADGDGYIEITDRSQIHCAPTEQENIEETVEESVEEISENETVDEGEWIAHTAQEEQVEQPPARHEVDFDEPVPQEEETSLEEETPAFEPVVEQEQAEEPTAEEVVDERLEETLVEEQEETPQETEEEPVCENAEESVEELTEQTVEQEEKTSLEEETPASEPVAEEQTPIVTETVEQPVEVPAPEQTPIVEQSQEPVQTKKEEVAPPQPTVIVVNERGEVLNPSGAPVIIIKEQAPAPIPEPKEEEGKKRVRVKSRASEMFKAYLSEKSTDEKHKLEDSIDHIVKNKKN